jgi:hypothetical protein
MSPQERKRQGYIHELLQTEERYVEDLQIVLEVTHTRRPIVLHQQVVTKCFPKNKQCRWKIHTG